MDGFDTRRRNDNKTTVCTQMSMNDDKRKDLNHF